MTVGILHCGELGTVIAQLLAADGFRVASVVTGRSPETRARAERAGVELFDTLGELLDTADVVLSTVHPAGALKVAQTCSPVVRPNAIYVDLNSIGIDSSKEICATVESAGFAYVAGSVQGMSAKLEDMGVVYLSGPRADDVVSLFGRVARVEQLGDDPHLAKVMKLLLAGTSKGLPMLFLEVAVIAERAGLGERFTTELEGFYPALAELINRSLPSYQQHAFRRIGEVAAIEELADSVGADHEMLAGARLLLEKNWKAWSELDSPPSVDAIVRSAAEAAPSNKGAAGDVLESPPST